MVLWEAQVEPWNALIALEGLDGSLGGSKEVRGGLIGPCGT